MSMKILAGSPEHRVLKVGENIKTAAEARQFLIDIKRFPHMADLVNVKDAVLRAQRILAAPEGMWNDCSLEQRIMSLNGPINLARCLRELPAENPGSVAAVFYKTGKTKMTKLRRGVYWNGEGTPPTKEDLENLLGRPNWNYEKLQEIDGRTIALHLETKLRPETFKEVMKVLEDLCNDNG